jgi:hypothetical protein
VDEENDEGRDEPDYEEAEGEPMEEVDTNPLEEECQTTVSKVRSQMKSISRKPLSITTNETAVRSITSKSKTVKAAEVPDIFEVKSQAPTHKVMETQREITKLREYTANKLLAPVTVANKRSATNCFSSLDSAGPITNSSVIRKTMHGYS